MSDVMIKASGLCKSYGVLAAISNVSFEVKRGQIVAFLGPNGAGKSTTMRILTGFMAPTRGHAEIAGLNVATDRIAAAAKLGYLPENGPLYDDMTPLALLRFFGGVRGLDAGRLKRRIDEVVRLCHIDTVLEKPISKLSRGYRQRVGMAHTLLHEPEVLILDEPTAGLDPNQIHDVRELIRRLGKSNTILLSTHILQEVEAVADRVVFIHEGRVVFDGTIDEFKAGSPSLDERFRKLTAA